MQNRDRIVQHPPNLLMFHSLKPLLLLSLSYPVNLDLDLITLKRYVDTVKIQVI